MSLRDVTEAVLELQIATLEKRIEARPDRVLPSDRANLEACYRESDRRAGIRDDKYNLILPIGVAQ